MGEMAMKEKYYNINSKYLAYGLAYLGYTFYKFTDDKGKIVYSFIATESFHNDLNILNKIKNCK